MKINEVIQLKTYIATVRVVLRDGSTTARTVVNADTYQQARAILLKLYGDGNVFSISETFSESRRTHQINAEASFHEQRIHRQHRAKKNAPAVFSGVAETESATRVLSPAELQVKSLSDKADDFKQQAKAMKARQQMMKAQQNLMKASRGASAS